MTIKDVAHRLMDGIENCYSEIQKRFIEQRLEEIRKEDGITITELDDLCFEDSCGMFDRIFSH